MIGGQPLQRFERVGAADESRQRVGFLIDRRVRVRKARTPRRYSSAMYRFPSRRALRNATNSVPSGFRQRPAVGRYAHDGRVGAKKFAAAERGELFQSVFHFFELNRIQSKRIFRKGISQPFADRRNSESLCSDAMSCPADSAGLRPAGTEGFPCRSVVPRAGGEPFCADVRGASVRSVRTFLGEGFPPDFRRPGLLRLEMGCINLIFIVRLG